MHRKKFSLFSDFVQMTMQTLGKLLFVLVLLCYIATSDAKSKTVQENIVDGATHLKDNVVKEAAEVKETLSDGVKTGAKVAADAAKHAG